jgi:hypothetical protein
VLAAAAGRPVRLRPGFVKRHAAALSRIWTLGLTIVGTDTVITLLGFFSRNAVRQACRARGWRFDDKVVRQRGIGNTR